MSWQNCCRGRRSNCPQVLVDGLNVSIIDDEGNQITVTVDQLEDIQHTVKSILLSACEENEPCRVSKGI